MRLELEGPGLDRVVAQPLPFRLRFTNASGSVVRLPYELTTGPVTTLTLFDGTGRRLAELDGDTQQARRGLLPEVTVEERMVTGTVAPGAVVEWPVDLTTYVDLQPGVYAVRARLRFTPSGVDLASPEVRFRLRPLACRRLDVLADEAAMEMLWVLQQHHDAAFVHARSVFAPDSPWMAFEASPVPRVPAVLSESAFRTLETFEHDFTRLVAWLDGDRLTTAVVAAHRDEPVLARPRAATLAKAGRRIVGRPARDADGGARILVENEEGVACVELSPDGRIEAQGRLPLDDPWILAAACDLEGTLHLLSAPDTTARELGWTAVERDGTVRRRRFRGPIPEEPGEMDEPRLLTGRLDLKPRSGRAEPTVLLVGLLGEAAVWTADAVLRETPEWRWHRGRLETDAFGPGERVETADALRDGEDRLFTVLVTDLGRVLVGLGPGGRHGFFRCAGVEPAAVDQVRLVAFERGVHLVYPDPTEGLQRLRLSPRPPTGL